VFIDIDEADGEEITSLRQLVPDKTKKKKGKIDYSKGIGQFRVSTIADFVRATNPF